MTTLIEISDLKVGDEIGFIYNRGSHPGEYREVEVSEVTEHNKPGRSWLSKEVELLIRGIDLKIDAPRNFGESSISGGIELLNRAVEAEQPVDTALNETEYLSSLATEPEKPTNESRVHFADARTKIAAALYNMSGDQLATIYGEVCGGDSVDTVEFDSSNGEIVVQETVQETERLVRLRTSTVFKMMGVDDDAAIAKLKETLALNGVNIVLHHSLGGVVGDTDTSVEAVAG